MALDIEHPDELTDYLRQTRRIGPKERPQMRALAGGVSNRTVWVRREDGSEWVAKQALSRLRVEVDWFSDPARIHKEASGLRHLADLAPPGSVTPLVFEDRQAHLLAMTAVPMPHENWKSMLMAGRIEDGHVEQFGCLLARVHHNAASHGGRLAEVFDDLSFFQSLRLEPYYQYAAGQVPESADFYARLIDRTLRHRFTLVHGDYSPKNILVHQDRLVLLDHEVIHWGDGAFDIGFALAHLLSKAHRLADHRRRFAEAAKVFWSAYQAETNWPGEVERRAVHHTLGCLLARVRGRSTLEYLDPVHRRRQQHIVLELMAAPPSTLPALIGQFVDRLDGYEN